MALSKKPYKGTRDFFPPEKRVQDYLFHTMRQTAQLYGYEPYDGPLLEEVELYKAKSGEELINEQIYSFHDRGERFVAIRPEMTPTLARMISQVHKTAPKPIRWFSIPNLYRYEKPQRGRLREHWQFNCDIFGTDNYHGELEILQILITLFENFGAHEEHFEILLNDREIVECIFSKLMGLDKEAANKLYKIVDKSKKVDSKVLEKMIDEQNLSSKQKDLFNSYLSLRTFEDLFLFLQKYKCSNVLSKIQNFHHKLSALELNNYVKYDPTIVRGLDYYTGPVFEVFDKNPENRRALCGGGSYAHLLKIFNEEPLPGTGFGLGDVTLTDFLKTHDLLPDFSLNSIDLYLTFQENTGEIPSLKLARKLRKLNVKVSTHLEPIKLKKAFPMAEKKGALFIGILGEQEIQNKVITIKNLMNQQQVSIPWDKIKEFKTLLNKVLTI